MKGEHGQESRRVSPQPFLQEQRGLLHMSSCDQPWAPAAPQTVPRMKMLSGFRLMLNPTEMKHVLALHSECRGQGQKHGFCYTRIWDFKVPYECKWDLNIGFRHLSREIKKLLPLQRWH